MAPSAQARQPRAPQAETLVTTGDLVVQTYLKDDRTLVSVQTYGDDSEGLVLGGLDSLAATTSTAGPTVSSTRASKTLSALDSGSGGSTTASGCRRVTVNNVSKTLLGFTAFIFHTWTHWCWNRSTQVISDVQHGWYNSDIDSQHQWKGIVNTEFTFYDYSTNDGHPKSAYKNYQQGHFTNCIVKYGCIGDYYPSNLLRSYYNGTWVWSTNG